MDKSTLRKLNTCIRRIAEGDTASLDVLFALTKKPLLVVARSYLSDKSKAEDVLSDSYLKIVRSAKSCDPERNAYNWMYEIVKNTALSQNEKDRLRAHPSAEETDLPDIAVTDALLNRILIREAAENLTAEEKRIVYLYFFEGRTVREIGEILGKPKSTAGDLLKRTLEKMRKNLKTSGRTRL